MKVKDLQIGCHYKMSHRAIACLGKSRLRFVGQRLDSKSRLRFDQFELLSIKSLPRMNQRWILRNGGFDSAQLGVLMYVGTFDNKNETKLHRFYSHMLKRNIDTAGCFIQNILSIKK